MDMKGIMNNDAVVVIGTGQGCLQLPASSRSGGYTGSIDLVGAECHRSESAPVRPHTGTGG